VSLHPFSPVDACCSADEDEIRSIRHRDVSRCAYRQNSYGRDRGFNCHKGVARDSESAADLRKWLGSADQAESDIKLVAGIVHAITFAMIYGIEIWKWFVP
jgi:hypothetical protein